MANQKKLLRSHVERCLQDIWDVCRVESDGDGDYPFRNGTAAGFVRVDTDQPAVVRVFAYAVTGIRRSAKLLTEVNDLNNRCRTVRVQWSDNAVIVDQTLTVAALNRTSLRQACDSVGFVANDVGTMIATVHGGHTPFDADDPERIDQVRKPDGQDD